MSTTRAPQRIRPMMFGAIAASCAVLFVTACAGGSEQEPEPTETVTETPPPADPPEDGDGEEAPPLEEQILGAWASDDPGDPFLEFAEDGSFSGSDGCNGVSGTYAVDAELVQLERAPSTLKACPDIDDWLSEVQSVTVDEEDLLQAYDSDEEHIGQMQRSE